MRYAMLAVVMLTVAVGCGGGGEPFSLIHHGTPAPTVPPPTPAGVEVYGVTIVPPTWLMAADVPPLEIALSQYFDDGAAALGGWRPSSGSRGGFPLTIAFHDVRASNFWQPTTRTAWLEWPKGASGKPRSVAFAPLLHNVLVLDRRRELRLTGPWSQQEIDAVSRGLNLQIRFNTNYPQDFEP